MVSFSSTPNGVHSKTEKLDSPKPLTPAASVGRFNLWKYWLRSFLGVDENPARDGLWSLLLVSFASLYMEIMLIRWISTEVGVFAYFQNLTLIACFLGFGLGCFRASQKKRFLFDLTALAYLVAAIALPFAPLHKFIDGLSNSLALRPDAALWGFRWTNLGHTGALIMFVASLFMVAALLILIVKTMVPLGQWVGFYLDRAANPITAYSVNLLGSLAGIWVFAAAAFLWIPPVYWFGLIFLLYLLFRPAASKLTPATVVLLLVSLVLLGISGYHNFMTIWSPYQEIQVQSVGVKGYNVRVNYSGYMTIANLSPAVLAKHPEWQHYFEDSSYDAPFRFVGHCGRVLIVGAGAGNDAAAALRHCSGQIDAVEIDPAIYYLGKHLHPQHPYLSPRVHVIIDDARAFMRNGREKYGTIVFGLLDSHTDFSGFSNMRIDNYVYTEQAFQEARRLLAPHGILVLKFEVRNPWTWMGSRFYRMLTNVFGRPPIVFQAGQIGGLLPATVFLESNDPGLWRKASQPALAAFIHNNPPPFSMSPSDQTLIATDNWPYVYHRSRSIPTAYLSVSLILLLLSVLFVRRSFNARRRSTWLFFFLGGGFMLLETQLVSRLALYFGTTWMVNCIALSAILIVLVVANLYVECCHPRHLGIYFLLLIASLAGVYIFPWGNLSLSAHAAGLLLSVAYLLPLFMAGVIFTDTFRRAEGRSSAFAANILGAVAGGLTQNLSFIFGMNALLLIAAVFYLSAGFCFRMYAVGETAGVQALPAD